MLLYGYWRSSSSYRVRIALHWKRIAFTQQPINLLACAQRSPEYLQIAPSGFVPALRLEDGRVLTESLAICEYLDERWPAPPLLPVDPYARARARSVALTVASRIQPFQNLSVLEAYPKDERAAHARAVITPGLALIEALLAQEEPAGPFCVGAAPSLADVCVVPQLYSARRFGVELAAFPRLLAAEAAALALPAFAAAHPDRQPDAVAQS